MNTLLNALSTNGLKYSLLAACCGLLLWAGGCPPTAPSLINPANNLTRDQLVVEIEHLLDQYEVSLASIERQERFRKHLLDNTLGFASAANFSPLSIVTFIGALYGAGSAVKDGAGVARKRRDRKLSNTV